MEAATFGVSLKHLGVFFFVRRVNFSQQFNKLCLRSDSNRQAGDPEGLRRQGGRAYCLRWLHRARYALQLQRAVRNDVDLQLRPEREPDLLVQQQRLEPGPRHHGLQKQMLAAGIEPACPISQEASDFKSEV